MREAQTTFRRRLEALRRRRRRPLLRAVLVLARSLALLAPLLALVLWLLASPQFSLRHVAVGRTTRVDPQWVDHELRSFTGRNLMALRLTTIKRVLERHPWVESANLRKELPDTLAVDLIEHQPVATLRTARGHLYLTRDAAPIAEATETGALLELRSRRCDVALDARCRAELRGALELAAGLDQGGPSWAFGLSQIETLGHDEYRVRSRSLPFPVVLSGSRGVDAETLEQLLPEIERRFEVAAIDLRFERRIVIRERGSSHADEEVSYGQT